MTLRIRNGLPTKTDIQALIDRHGLIAHRLDMWVRHGSFSYSYRIGANERAGGVSADLRSAGFTVEHSPADNGMGRNGVVRVKRIERPNAKVSGAGTASAGLPGYAGDNNGERK